MSSSATHEDIARLLTTFNIEIDSLPDDLKCGECKSVLKDAYQLPCGCQFCCTCIDDVMAIGAQFCSGASEECSGTPLSTGHRDFRANRGVSRLIAKCPLSGCSHECQLADMEGHLRVCPRKSVDCPFREFGCLQNKLAAEKISGHLQLEILSHSKILIGMVANINMEMEVLKLNNEASKAKIEMLECELVLKDEQIKTIIDELTHVQNENKPIRDENKSMKDENKSIKEENKSIKDKIESIKREKEILSDRLSQLSEKLKGEIIERRESDERDIVSITAIGEVIGSFQDALETEIQPVKEDIRSIKCDIDSLKWQVKSARAALGLGRVDANCDEWLINVNVSKIDWKCWDKTSDIFWGFSQPRAYQLSSWNGTMEGELWIWLRILARSSDSVLEWPFRNKVTIIVAHRDKSDVFSRQTRQCQIDRPSYNQYNFSEPFKFKHSALKSAGLDLKWGVHVSCQILICEGQ